MRTIRIGSGAGYSGDRIEPAVELAEKGDIDYLVFECLGERTVALAQQARMKNPEAGFDPLLEERMRAVLPLCAAKGIKVTSPLTDQWWGDRTFTVMDPFGYQTWFYQTVREPIPPKGAKLV